MLKDKRKDLDGEKQKQLLKRLVEEMSQMDSDIYYRPTSYIASQIKACVEAGDRLSLEEQALLKSLSQRDIEVLLSLH
ncbi:MAG: hypothetical protein AAF590_00260 [Pseudomonadota bacterium]